MTSDSDLVSTLWSKGFEIEVMYNEVQNPYFRLSVKF